MTYRLSFGSNRLLVKEASDIINLYLELSDWSKVKEQATEDNILGYETKSSIKRVVHEHCIRLKELSEEELNFFSEADLHDRTLLCWLSVCRTYPLVGDFTSQIIMESFHNFRERLDTSSFEFFVEDEKSKYPELAKISDVYISTMVRVLFHMLREVKILSDKNELQSVLPSYTLLSLIEQGKNDAHLFFPMR
jgi:hypothetical protein